MYGAIEGNLAADPETGVSKEGRHWTRMRVAADTGRDQSPDWYSVVSFGKLAQESAAALHKGDRIVAAGNVRQRQWQTKDGDPRTDVLLYADHIGASVRFGGVTLNRAATPAPTPEPATGPVTDWAVAEPGHSGGAGLN